MDIQVSGKDLNDMDFGHNMMRGCFASGVLKDGNAYVLDMTGAPIPCSVGVKVASGDTVAVSYSYDGGKSWFTMATTSVDYENQFTSSVSHMKFQCTAGNSGTSTWGVC